nr:MAG TPA: CysA-like protein [Caudoviricetes sp.]
MRGMNALVKTEEVTMGIRPEAIDTRCISSVTMHVTVKCTATCIFGKYTPVQIVDIIINDAGVLLTFRSIDQELADWLHTYLCIDEGNINVTVFIRDNCIICRNEDNYFEVDISDYTDCRKYCQKVYDEIGHKVDMERFYENNRSLGFYKAIIMTFLNLPDNMINLLKKERLHEH